MPREARTGRAFISSVLFLGSSTAAHAAWMTRHLVPIRRGSGDALSFRSQDLILLLNTMQNCDALRMPPRRRLSDYWESDSEWVGHRYLSSGELPGSGARRSA
ncbi:exported hypothetical protein [Thiomonas sp. CB2]|nr:exported hypothetical protein [Thiomonas sp. CB2]VDY09947.1 exported protein of unknown function [Thiomonas sp. Sup16B3]VDY15030.1 conserved exported protein of unknown function [Thiomonas sp. OC7]